MMQHYNIRSHGRLTTVYPEKYAHGFVVLCFVVVMQSFIMNSHEVFIHIHQGCFAGTGAIVRLPQCQWSKPDGYGKISQCITTTKQKPCAYFLGYTVVIMVQLLEHFGIFSRILLPRGWLKSSMFQLTPPGWKSGRSQHPVSFSPCQINLPRLEQMCPIMSLHLHIDGLVQEKPNPVRQQWS